MNRDVVNVMNLYLDRDNTIDFNILNEDGTNFYSADVVNVYFTIKQNKTDTDADAILALDNSGAITVTMDSDDGTYGTIDIGYDDIDSASIDEGEYFFELSVGDSTLGRITVDIGIINFIKPILKTVNIS